MFKLKKGDLVKGLAHETGDEYGGRHFFELSKCSRMKKSLILMSMREKKLAII
jgi:hypothetical protein